MFGLTHPENQGSGGEFGGRQRKGKVENHRRTFSGLWQERQESTLGQGCWLCQDTPSFHQVSVGWDPGGWWPSRFDEPLVIAVSISTSEQSPVGAWFYQGLFSCRWLENKVWSKTPKNLPKNPQNTSEKKWQLYHRECISFLLPAEPSHWACASVFKIVSLYLALKKPHVLMFPENILSMTLGRGSWIHSHSVRMLVLLPGKWPACQVRRRKGSAVSASTRFSQSQPWLSWRHPFPGGFRQPSPPRAGLCWGICAST